MSSSQGDPPTNPPKRVEKVTPVIPAKTNGVKNPPKPTKDRNGGSEESPQGSLEDGGLGFLDEP